MSSNPPNPIPGYGYTLSPRPTNGMAVASLVCSILGFCVWFIGGFLGIIFGIIGIRRAKQTGTGYGMAVGGLVIGIVSLIVPALFLGIGGASLFAVFKMSEAPRNIAHQYVADLSAGKIDAAEAQTSGISRSELESQSNFLQGLGAFNDMTSNNININNNVCTLNGTAIFAKGSRNYTIKLTQFGKAWKVTGASFQ